MKSTMKFAMLVGGLVATVGFASAPLADEMVNNYVSSKGGMVKNSTGSCWRTRFEDTTDRLVECGYPPPAQVMTKEVEIVAAPTAATMTTTMMEKVAVSAAMLFGFDSADLSDDAKAVIDERIQAFKGQARLTAPMQIVGHTDSTGAEDYNMALSVRRAQAVADYIIEEAPNVNAADVQIKGMGETDPIASNSTREGRAENRRVVLFAEGEKGK